MLRLLDDPDLDVVKGAARGLAALGDGEYVRRLGDILAASEDERSGLRIEVALLLGNIGTTEAREALAAGYQTTADDELRVAIIDSLGKYPFIDTEEIFRNIVGDESADVDFRVRAVEALAASDGDGLGFLAETLTTHEDAEVRASAAWALGVAM